MQLTPQSKRTLFDLPGNSDVVSTADHTLDFSEINEKS